MVAEDFVLQLIRLERYGSELQESEQRSLILWLISFEPTNNAHARVD